MTRSGWLLDLRDGVTPYADAWALQRRLVAARQQGAIEDGLILLEHEPVFTLGRSARPEHLPFSHGHLAELGFGLFEIERGGSVTYHGPGQLVGYPIVNLRNYDEDVVRFMRMLEETLLRTLADFGIAAGREAGYPGVWAAGAKIAAIGVAVKRKVTMHGFALNVDPDLRHFSYINPCGLDRPVTSMARMLGHPVAMPDVRSAYVRRFSEVYGVTLTPTARDILAGLSAPARADRARAGAVSA